MDPASISACTWDAAYLLIFSPNVGPLVYYSHLLPLVVSLFLGVLVVWNAKRSLVQWNLFFLTFMFSVWVYFDLILWASPSPEYVMFFWSAIVPVEMMIYASAFYLVYLFCHNGADAPLRTKTIIAAFFIPVVLLMHTKYNLLGLSPDCDQGVIEGPLIQYMYIVELIFILWTALVATRAYERNSDPLIRKQIRTIGLGTVAFLVSFTAGNITLIFSVNPDYEQYKLFGMPIFAAFITYSILKFKTFNLKIVAAQALVLALGILVFSLLALPSLALVHVVTVFTFMLVCVLGYILIQSVKSEVRQREEVERLSSEKSEFMAFASHEIRNPITAMRGYASLIMDGTTGESNEQTKKAAEQILLTGDEVLMLIAQFLDRSKLELGKISYSIAPFNMSTAVTQLTEGFKTHMTNRGLQLYTTIDPAITVTGDLGKFKEVLGNVLDNSLKYTREGAVTVQLHATNEIARVTVSDTGAGIAEDVLPKLFQKFSRADAQKANLLGTGLGLYLGKTFIEGMGGKIWAESEGKGKGARFIIELPRA